MNGSFKRALAHYQRSVFALASTGTVTVNGDLVHLVPSLGMTLDATSSQLVATYTDQKSSSVGTPISASWVGAPRFLPYGINGNNGIYYPGAGFVGINFDATARAIKNNVPGISAVMQLVLYATSGINAPILFISQGTNNGTNGFTIGSALNNALYGAFRRTDTGATVTVTTPDNFYTPGECFTLAVTADFASGNGTDSVVTFYKNGVATYTSPLTGSGIGNTSATNALVFNLGGTAGATIGPNMRVGEAYFYPRSLSPSDVVVQTSLLRSNAGVKNLQVLTPTSFQAFNRDLVTNVQNIAITGLYNTTAAVQPTAIEASWNGSAYTTIASGSVGTMTGGSFSGTLANMPPGQGTLTVRYTNDTSQSTQKRFVSVTDFVLEIGQSNNTTVLDPTYSDANGAQSPKTYTLGSSGMKIPVFNSHFSYGKWGDANKLGSYHVAFALDFYNRHGFPPAIVFAALGGTNSTKWRSDSSDVYGGSNITQSFYDTFGLGQTLVARAISMGNTASTNTGINAIHDEQGEADAGSGGTLQATYLANKTNTYATLRTAFPKAVIMPALLQGQVGSGGTAIDVSNVNNAYIQAFTTLPGVAPGADLSALNSDLGGSGVTGLTRVHLMSDANVAAQAAAWATASQAAMGYGPILDYITTNSNRSAHSLRKVLSTYSGAAINARRADGALLDIGFDAYGNLDLAALATFAGTSNVTVATIYDQTPLAAHYVAPATANQGLIVVGGVINLRNGRPFIQFDQSTTYYDMASAGLAMFNAVGGAFVSTALTETQNSATSPAYRIIMTAQVNTSTSSRFSVSTNNNGSTNNQLSSAYRKTDAGSIAFNFSGTGAGAQYVGLSPFIHTVQHSWAAATDTIYFNGTSFGAFATGQATGTTDATNSQSIRLGASAGVSPTQLARMSFNEIIAQGAVMSDIDRVKLIHSQGYAWGAAVA